jgi:hypothetical protein
MALVIPSEEMTRDLGIRANAIYQLNVVCERDITAAYDAGAITFERAQELFGLLRGDEPVSRRHAYRLLATARRNAE